MNRETINNLLSPNQLRTLYKHSVKTHKFYAKHCSFQQWIEQAEADFETGMWMLPFTRFWLGTLPEELNIRQYQLQHSGRRVVQKMIGKYTDINKLEMNSSACEGAHPLNIKNMTKLKTLKLDFEHVLNLKHLKNIYFEEVEIISGTLTPCKIEQSERFWEHCPRINHVIVSVKQPNMEFLLKLAQKSVKTLTLRNLWALNSGLPENLFENKEKVILENCLSRVPSHLITYFGEKIVEISTDLHLMMAIDVSKIKQSQRFKKGTFHIKIEESPEFENLRTLMWDLGKCEDKTFVLNVELGEQIQPNDLPYLSNKLEEYREHIVYTIGWYAENLPNITINWV